MQIGSIVSWLVIQKEASIAIKLVATYLQKSNNLSKYSEYPGRLKLDHSE